MFIREQCFQCYGFFPPAELITIGESVKICPDCDVKGRKAIEALEAPNECALCHTSSEELATREAGESFSMFIHWVDGVYAYLCRACDATYVLKRKDLYGKTRYGWERKVI